MPISTERVKLLKAQQEKSTEGRFTKAKKRLKKLWNSVIHITIIPPI